MANEEEAKLFAGHMGLCAVMMNVLIDKGVIRAEELIDRLAQARDAALQSQGGAEAAAALEEMLRHLLSAHGKIN